MRRNHAIDCDMDEDCSCDFEASEDDLRRMFAITPDPLRRRSRPWVWFGAGLVLGFTLGAISPI